MADRLPGIKARLAASTGYEWRVRELGVNGRLYRWEVEARYSDLPVSHPIASIYAGFAQASENAALIAHAGGDDGDLAWSVGEIERLRTRNDKLRAVIMDQGQELDHLSVDRDGWRESSQANAAEMVRFQVHANRLEVELDLAKRELRSWREMMAAENAGAGGTDQGA